MLRRGLGALLWLSISLRADLSSEISVLQAGIPTSTVATLVRFNSVV